MVIRSFGPSHRTGKAARAPGARLRKSSTGRFRALRSLSAHVRSPTPR
jgi:hypothetical protein